MSHTIGIEGMILSNTLGSSHSSNYNVFRKGKQVPLIGKNLICSVVSDVSGFFFFFFSPSE